MKERADLAKSYIESKYNRRRCEETERRDAWEMLEHKMNCLGLSEREKNIIKQDIQHKEAELQRKA
jgi:serine/threonine kinase 38